MTFSASSLTALFREWKSALPNRTCPRAFVRTLSVAAQRHLTASWIASETYETFQDLLDTVTVDTVASRARESETGLLSHLTETQVPPSLARGYQAALSQLNHDRLFLARCAADVYDKTVMPAALETITSNFEAVLAQLRARLPAARSEGAETLITPRLRLTNDVTDAKLPDEDRINQWLDDDDDTAGGIADLLLAEAQEYLPYLYLALLPNLDRSVRLKAIRELTLTLTGPRNTVRRSIDDLEDHICELNPDVTAPDYEALSPAMILLAIRFIALRRAEPAAKEFFIEAVRLPKGEDENGDTRVADTLQKLRDMPVDHERNMLLPWRAFLCTDRDSNPSRPAAGQTNPTVVESDVVSNVGTHSNSHQGTKPRARKVPGDDPYQQFRDRSKYSIPDSYTKFCSQHGHNSTHDTTECQYLKRQSSGGNAKPKPATEPEQHDTRHHSADRRADHRPQHGQRHGRATALPAPSKQRRERSTGRGRHRHAGINHHHHAVSPRWIRGPRYHRPWRLRHLPERWSPRPHDGRPGSPDPLQR